MCVFTNACSGPNDAPPAKDIAEQSTVKGAVFGLTWHASISLNIPGIDSGYFTAYLLVNSI